jgi:capsular exopolysaccharide synthesis family protein
MATEGARRENLYRVLGLEPRASRAQIERAYRFHVDMYGEDTLVASTLLDPAEAERQRRRVREAYDVLSDPERRRAYDERQGFPPPEPADPTLAAPGSGAPPPEPVPSSPAEGDRNAAVTFAEPAPASADVREPRLASLLAPDSPAFEAFRVLRTKVQALDAERPARCLGLVSATRREGTTAVAAGLAAALAQERGRRVLLVDARLRAPGLERALGLAVEPGLGEWLEGSAARPVPLRRVEPWAFHLLAGGAPLPRATEVLGSERFRLLLAAARVLFEFVLIDCPPLESAADAAVIQRDLDGFLFVVRARHASRQAIRQALARLEPGAVRGVVLNDRTEILARWLERRRRRPTF